MRRRRLRYPSPATVIALVALAVSLSGTAYAATGGSFILGTANTAGHVTSLTNSGGAALSLTGGGTSPTLRLSGPSTQPPLTVSSSALVPNLNASLLDGVHARDLQSQYLGAALFHGPLPTTVSDQVTISAGTVLILFTASGYRTTAQGPGEIAVDLLLCPGVVTACTNSTRGSLIVDQASDFTNEVNSHKGMTSDTIQNTLTPGTYTVGVDYYYPPDPTTTDANDQFYAQFIQLG